MPNIQSDIAKQTKKQENTSHIEEEKKKINLPKPTENRYRW